MAPTGPEQWDPFGADAVVGDVAYQRAKGVYLRDKGAVPGAPVVVWAMGKSGTSAVADALRRAGAAPVFHVHNLLARSLGAVEQEYVALDPAARPTHIWDAQLLLMLLGGRGPSAEAPWTVVSLVRDPLQVVVAAFFQAAGRRGLLGPDATVASLRTAFGERWRPPLDWFDVQMEKVVGLDVYAHPFDPAVGRATIDHDHLRVLLLRQEDLASPATAPALQAHVATPRPVELRRVNVGVEKGYAALYRRFQEEVRPPPEVVEEVCASRLVRHFYSAPEIAALRARWT